MPLPLFIAIAIGIMIISGGTVTVAVVYWDEITIWWSGKKVAVFGARGVGKTCLIKFLTTGSMPVNYKQTVAPEKTSQRRFQLKDLDIKLRETLDVSGDKAAYAEWKKLMDNADIVFYLMRADRLIARDTDVENHVRKDLKHISGWLTERTIRPELFLIGTHCDLDPEFNNLTSETIGSYTDKFNELPVMRDLILLSGGAAVTRVCLGSLKTEAKREDLAYAIFSQVKQ